MKTSSIERAARAFALKASGADEWDTLDAETRERLKDAVCAALMTLREPSAAVRRSGARRTRGIYRSSGIQAPASWRAMIDATIKDR